MEAPNSLSQFFARTDPVTLDNCAREAIHLSGQIQALGALIVSDPQSGRILGASQNAAAFFGLETEDLLARHLAEVDDKLASLVADDEASVTAHHALDFQLEHDGLAYDVVSHCHDGRRITEFVPNLNPSLKVIRMKMRQCSNACAQIIGSGDFDQALEIAVNALREITGHSRVKIYRFHWDWSGEVIAESSDGVLPSYRGLFFPSSDIPAQVRDIMRLVPYRAIGSAEDNTFAIHSSEENAGPLDLTWSVLRSSSKMHTQYMRNIEVGSAFSCSLLHEEQLWGLIAIHNKAAGLLPFDYWNLVNEVGMALMLRYAQQQRTETAETIRRLRALESLFASSLRRDGDIEKVLTQLVPVLRDFLGADGFAFLLGENLYLSGATPPEEFIRRLIGWIHETHTASDQFQTMALHALWPPALDHIDTCCGVLVQPIAVQRVCQLIWFRGPVTRKVNWAGKPADKSAGDILSPRASFEAWSQEHRDQAAPWAEAELHTAREMFSELLDIMVGQMLLRQENSDLKRFAAVAAHDLRAPLLGLQRALSWMQEDGFEPDAVKDNYKMARQASDRLSYLAQDLLELAVIDQQTVEMERVNLSDVISGVCDLLSAQIDDSGAVVEVADLPQITASPRLLTRLFLNLVGNALKYRSPERAPVIRIGAREAVADRILITVEDNGIGIATGYADRIFEPLQRLHRKDEIEGTGLGLTICRRIAEAHRGTITLDPAFVGGARFLIDLPVDGGKKP